jgi:DNA polymerase III gamma/tau subunit
MELGTKRRNKKLELYKQYRPKKFKQVVGQAAVIKQLESMSKREQFPHASLFLGPSGCGKTTLARIIRKELNCGDQDFAEVNCADFRGIDMVRDIRSRMNLAPISGETRVWLIDEAHQLSSQAQNAFLKLLEDTPNHVYFMLATTDPQKLLTTIRTRCTEFKVTHLTPNESESLLNKIAKREEISLPEEVSDLVIKHGEGSPRKLLVLLDAIRHLDEEEAIQMLLDSGTKKEAIEIARLLLSPRTTWSEMTVVLKAVQEEPESLRWMVLGYMNSVLLKNGKPNSRAYTTIEAFRENFYDSKKAGLTAACYEIIQGE